MNWFNKMVNTTKGALKNTWNDFKNWVTNTWNETVDNINEGKNVFNDYGNEETTLGNIVNGLNEQIGIKDLVNNIDKTFKEAKPEYNGMQDKTNESTSPGTNEEVGAGHSFNMEELKALRQEQWDREDAIRAETQAREDNAYQRAVEDMIKAGVNPNLVGVTPAASGGGITQASSIDYTSAELDIEKTLTELENFLDRELNASEGQKNRFSQLISAIIMGLLMKKK